MEYLLANFKDKKVYLVGTDALKQEYKDSGVNIVEDNPDVCVLAYDTTLTFEKLVKMNNYLTGNVYYIATHPDTLCPAKDAYMPDVGSFIKLFECSSGRLPDIIIGKPYSTIGDLVKSRFQASASEIMMVGDRLNTDIRFGNNNNFKTMLVLSGETTLEAAKNSTDKPTLIFESLNDIVKYLN
jgi:HAD superfamily hydrolase (TIGR01450 family)